MSTTKIGGNRTNILNCYFSKYMYTLAHQTIYLHMENYITSHKQYFFGLLFSRNAKKTDAHQSILQTFLIQSQKKRLRNLLKKQIQKSLSFHVITATSIFYTNLSLQRVLVQLPCCYVLSSKCFKRSPHFISIISTLILRWC